MISKTAIKKKIIEYEDRIKDLQRKIDALKFTFSEFYSDQSDKRSLRHKPNEVQKGIHPLKVKELLRRYPHGLTNTEIISKLQSEMNHRITPGTLASVLNRNKGELFTRGEKIGRAYKWQLKQILEAVANDK